MTPFEDDPANTEMPSGEPARDSGSVVTSDAPPAEAAVVSVPPDLRISWSWPHFIVFLLFGIGSQFVVVMIFSAYLETIRGFSAKEVEHALTTKAPFAVAIQLSWFAFMLLFLYVTLSVLRNAPFWSTMGWRRFPRDKSSLRNRVWPYFFSGSALAAVVTVGGIRLHPKEGVPIEELFKDPHGQLLLMAMAVLAAPLVEETIFRGYLYPVLARIVSAVAQFFGMEFTVATRAGVLCSILMTGTLFGLMHGAQLGWNWGIVSLLVLVGMVFTYARARTGTVLASYLLHLGYNSLIALSTALVTRGFQYAPPAH